MAPFSLLHSTIVGAKAQILILSDRLLACGPSRKKGARAAASHASPKALAVGLTAVIILADFGADVHRYRREFSRLPFPRPKRCPKCAAEHIIGHGSYPRHVCDDDVFAIRVKRFICTLCRHTISFLPSFCLP